MGDRVAAPGPEARRGSQAAPARLAEATALLAVATDLSTGMPLTTSLRTCLAALRIAELLDDDSLDRGALFHYCLVRLMGCTVETSRFAGAMGNEIVLSTAMVPVDQGSPREMLPMVLRSVGAGEAPLRRVRLIMSALSFGSGMKSVMAGHCEVSRMLTDDLRLGDEVTAALDNTYERWDGKGAPHGVRGESIPLITRVMQGAFQAVVQEAAGGEEQVRAVARKRAAGGLDPGIADILASHAEDVLDATHVNSPWDAVLAAEPGVRRTLSDQQMDATATAIGCFADLKADAFAGHSAGVARRAVDGGRAQGMSNAEITELNRAALIHDLGRVAVTTTIWDKRGPLADDEWEEVRLHAYHTDRVAGRVPWLSGAARTAGLHHERLDGAGYHRGCGPSGLTASARLLAAADCYRALCEPRPYRPAHSRDEAAKLLSEEARAGRLDADAVACLLEGAGHPVSRAPRVLPAGLTEREIEVLRVIAKGATVKQAAYTLHLAPKTVDAHVQHIYDKVGCTTRAGAAVFAMREGLLDPAI